MNDFKYPKYLPKGPSAPSQYWEDPHSIIVMNGGNGLGNGSASFGKQNLIGFGIGFRVVVVVVVEVVGGPVYTHSLEYEFSYIFVFDNKMYFSLTIGPIF